jgi:phosphoglycolate phosphatase
MNSKTIKGIIFDLDGTLLDTLGDLTEAINRTAQDYHQPILTKQQVSDNIGNGFKVTVTKSLPGVDASEIPNAVNRFKTHYAQCFMEDSKPYEGIHDLLGSLVKRNIRLAVVSNKVHDYVVQLIMSRFPEVSFDLIYGEDDTRKRKPDPQGLLEACAKMGLQPDEVLMIGDSEADLLSAQAISMGMLAVSWGFNSVEKLTKAGCTRFVSDPQEVLEAL